MSKKFFAVLMLLSLGQFLHSGDNELPEDIRKMLKGGGFGTKVLRVVKIPVRRIRPDEDIPGITVPCLGCGNVTPLPAMGTQQLAAAGSAMSMVMQHGGSCIDQIVARNRALLEMGAVIGFVSMMHKGCVPVEPAPVDAVVIDDNGEIKDEEEERKVETCLDAMSRCCKRVTACCEKLRKCLDKVDGIES